MMPPGRIAVCLEVTPKQAVAAALDWPGWCRAGRDEQAALAALASYAGRYAPVAAHAGLSIPATAAFEVAERVPGGPATAFAAPECRRPFPQTTAKADRAALTPRRGPAPGPPGHRGLGHLRPDRHRLTSRAAQGPARRRPRPGPDHRPRDRHRQAYARKLEIRPKQPPTGDTAAISELREAITAVLGAPSDGTPVLPGGWTTRYAAHRIAWHILEHAWEMQDRAES